MCRGWAEQDPDTMLQTIITLLPVFLTIMLGAILKQTGLVKDDHWASVEHVAYYVLFPAIVMKSIAVADFSGVPVFRMALAMILAILTMYALIILFRKPLQLALAMDGPAYTSFFQGVTRWHTFLALAILPLVFGPQGIALGALAAAAMIPLLNVGAVSALSTYASGTSPSVRGIARSLITNPFVLSSMVGIFLNATGLGLTGPLEETFDLIGRGALAAALLSAGAGLRFRQLRAAGGTVAAATAVKLLIMPAFMWGWTTLLGVDGLPQAVAIVSGGVPTAAAAYILARKMGGDAPLMALILTAQVLAAAITLPVLITLAKQIAGV
jgi:predicted permease